MIRIVTDSAADFEPAEYQALNVSCIPLTVMFGDAEYQENVNLSKDQFYALIHETGLFPKTAQASPQILLDLIEEAKTGGDDIIYISISSAISGTYQNALMTRNLAEYDRAFVVDSRNATGGQRMLVEYAARLRNEGKTAEEIVAALEQIRDRVVLYACMDTLEYLYRGGRISHTVYTLGSLAQIKPIIMLDREGKVEVPAKAMGMRKGMDYLCKRLEQQKPDPAFPVYAMYTENKATGEALTKKLSALSDDSRAQVEELAKELCREYLAQQDATANKNDLDALNHIGYGLYVVTSQDGQKDNGLIVNTVTQVTDSPKRVAVTINKQNYSHHIIRQTGKMNVNCLDISAPFSVFENFGFRSGRTADKFQDIEELRSDNGLRFLPRHINAMMSLKVEDYVDLGSHGMFICSVTEARVISDRESMTYAYYHQNVKPKPETEGKKGFVCKVCGWVYEGKELPDDIVCPLCKHGAADFEPIG